MPKKPNNDNIENSWYVYSFEATMSASRNRKNKRERVIYQVKWSASAIEYLNWQMACAIVNGMRHGNLNQIA